MIGAGIGGIATAARLAKNGYEVTVLEKESTPGGRCNQIVRDGHRFDIGPTLFLMPEVWEETFASLGEKMSDHLDLKRIDLAKKLIVKVAVHTTGDLAFDQRLVPALRSDLADLHRLPAPGADQGAQDGALLAGLGLAAVRLEDDDALLDVLAGGGGAGDLERGILRHVSPAFVEDPVRLLRVARFAARLPDFTVADVTIAP